MEKTDLDFWNVPFDEVVTKTGAREVMDCSDLKVVLDHFNVDLSKKRVIDVGCGTGRLAQLCGDYQGFDLSPAMVEYARSQPLSRKSFAIDYLQYAKPVDVVTCFSVFTHIPRIERNAYLQHFHYLAPTVIVDIVPGEEHGDVAIWYANQDHFEKDMEDAGFSFQRFMFGRIPSDGVEHAYYLASRM